MRIDAVEKVYWAVPRLENGGELASQIQEKYGKMLCYIKIEMEENEKKTTPHPLAFDCLNL